MLASTLFFATLVSSLFTAGSAITVADAQNLVQCKNSTLGWTQGSGPYQVNVYTGCSDSTETPIASYYGLTAPTCTYWVNQISGATIMYEVIDSTGTSYWSGDNFVGGNSGADATTCENQIKSANLEVQTVNATAVANTPSSSSVSASAVAPTTASDGLDGVANAEETSTSSSAKSTATAGVAGGNLSNGAGINAAPSTQLALGLLGAALLALL